MGPYAYLRDQWVSFDDVDMIRHKSEYTRAMGLGGAMIWALDLDDFRNRCDCEEYPLLRTINRVLRGYPGPAPRCKLETNTEIDSSYKPTTSRPTTTTQSWQRPTTTTEGWQRPTTTRKPDIVTRPPHAGTTASDVEVIGASQACKGRVFAPHPTDCNKYYLCTFGAPQVSNLLTQLRRGMYSN